MFKKFIKVLFILVVLMSISYGEGAPRFGPIVNYSDNRFGNTSVSVDKIIVAASDSPPSALAGATYVCNGVDDEVEINTALASSTDGTAVHLVAGSYQIFNSINVPYSYSNFSMDKNATLYVNQAQTTLAAEAVPAAATITVDNASDFKEGMYIRISNDAHCNVRSIDSISDNVITLADGLYVSSGEGETGDLGTTYAIGDDVVQVYDAIYVGSRTADTEFITLDGINIDGQWDELEPADGAEDGNTDDVLPDAITIKTDYYLNGIRVPRTNNILIQNCNIIDVLYNAILFHGGSLSESSRIVDNYILTSSTASQSRGIAHESTDNFFIISGNICETTATTGSLTNCMGIYVNSSETYNYGVIRDNYVKGWYVGINLFGGSRNVSICNNKSIECSKYGMRFTKTNYSECIGNTIDMRAGGDTGMYVDSTSPASTHLLIKNNKFLNIKTGYKGLRIYGTYHFIIDNIFHTDGTMNFGAEIKSTHNHKIDGNMIVGSYNYGVCKEITPSVLVCEPTCDNRITSSAGAVAATLADGENIGQIILITMRNATNSSTLTIANHETSSPEVVTFDATTDWIALQWSGVEWKTIGTTCTFP